jgi:hypothetical protein
MRIFSKDEFLSNQTLNIVYVKKPECPVLCTGMNGLFWFGGASPKRVWLFQAFLLESTEESPDLWSGFFTLT